MRTAALLATLASLASARIVGFAVPHIIAPDADIKVEIITENYVQAITDVAISFGLSPANTSYPGSLSKYLSSKFLGPGESCPTSVVYAMLTPSTDFSNTIENITHVVHIPATTAKGTFVLTAAHFALTGTSVSPDLESYAVNVTVGDAVTWPLLRSYRIDDQ